MMKENSVRLPFYKQPFLHFLLGGAVIFLLSAVRGERANETDKIIVTVPQVERMAALWSQTWQRPPTEAELQGLVRDHIKEEIYYREALKLGLNVNDTIIRRRLRQKMEFAVSPELAEQEPDEAQLQAYLEANAKRYMRGAVYDFQQIYFAQDNKAGADAALAALNAGSLPSGDKIGLPSEMQSADERDIGRLFGSTFYSALADLPLESWSGPVQSGFGYHLVRISNAVPPQLPPLSQIRQTVQNDWQNDQRIAAQQKAFEVLLAKYDVDIEAPDE